MFEYDIVDVLKLYSCDNTISDSVVPEIKTTDFPDNISEITLDSINSHIDEFKHLIKKVYNSIYFDIFNKTLDDIDELLYLLNIYFREKGIAYQKFDLKINLDELYIFFKILVKNNIENIDYIEEMFYMKLGLTSPNVTMNEAEYWNINFNPVDILIEIFN